MCGTKYIAESAYIISKKNIIIPSLDAGCSITESMDVRDVISYKNENPKSVIVTTLNSSSEVMSVSDYIVSDDNAENIINNIPEDMNIFFGPNKNLGNFLKNKTGRNIAIWNGKCIVHDKFSESDLVKIKTEYPYATILVHSECNSNILNYADFVGNSSSLVKYVKENPGKEYIVLAEPGVIYNMKNISPNGIFIDIPIINDDGNKECSICPHMRQNSIEKLYIAMKNLFPLVSVGNEIANNVKVKLLNAIVF